MRRRRLAAATVLAALLAAGAAFVLLAPQSPRDRSTRAGDAPPAPHPPGPAESAGHRSPPPPTSSATRAASAEPESPPAGEDVPADRRLVPGVALVAGDIPLVDVGFMDVERLPSEELVPFLTPSATDGLASRGDGTFTVPWDRGPGEILLLVRARDARLVAVENGERAGEFDGGPVVRAEPGRGPLLLRFADAEDAVWVRPARAEDLGSLAGGGRLELTWLGESTDGVPRFQQVRAGADPSGWLRLPPPAAEGRVAGSGRVRIIDGGVVFTGAEVFAPGGAAADAAPPPPPPPVEWTLHVVADGRGELRVPRADLPPGRHVLPLPAAVAAVRGRWVFPPGARQPRLLRIVAPETRLAPALPGPRGLEPVRPGGAGADELAVFDLPQGDWLLEAAARGADGRTRWAERRFYYAGRTVDLGEIPFTDGAGMRVRFVDRAEAPVARTAAYLHEVDGLRGSGAVVAGGIDGRFARVRGMVGAGAGEVVRPDGTTARLDEDGAGTTDDNGTVEFCGLRPGGLYRVALEIEGDAGTEVRLPRAPGGIAVVEVRSATRLVDCRITLRWEGRSPDRVGVAGGPAAAAALRWISGVLEGRLPPGRHDLVLHLIPGGSRDSTVVGVDIDVPDQDLWEGTLDLRKGE